MERKKVTRGVHAPLSETRNLKELQEEVTALIKRYGEDAYYIIYSDDTVSEYVHYDSLETDNEYQERTTRLQRIQQQAEEKERKEFERLKAKYGG